MRAERARGNLRLNGNRRQPFAVLRKHQGHWEFSIPGKNSANQPRIPANRSPTLVIGPVPADLADAAFLFMTSLFIPQFLLRLCSRMALLASLPFSVNAFSIIAPTFLELVAESADIVRGEVVSVEPFRTTSANGTPIIKTRVTWRVTSSLKGAENETFTLEFLGGRIGAESLSVSGMPEFTVGDDDYLFVEPDRRAICPLIAAGHGRYSVRVDEATGEFTVFRGNGRPLGATSDVAAPLDNDDPAPRSTRGLTPAEFESEILSTLNRPGGHSGDR